MELIDCNGIEIHFYLNNDSHSLDSYLLNKSNSQLLRLFKHVSGRFDVSINIETVAIEEGGFRQIWKIIGKNSGQISVLLSLLMLLLMLKPATNSEIDELRKQNLILENEKLELEIENLKNDIDNENSKIINEKRNLKSTQVSKRLKSSGILDSLNNEQSIVKTKSDYYKSLLDSNEINSIQSSILFDKTHVIESELLESNDFNDFIRNKEDIPGEIVSNAIIKIVSPVLENRHYKWAGEYNSDYISFYLNDDTFKTSIESSDISFSHGDTLNCELEIRKKLNENGDIVVSSYAVNIVYKLASNSTREVIETEHGKKRKRISKIIKSQVELDFDKQ